MRNGCPPLRALALAAGIVAPLVLLGISGAAQQRREGGPGRMGPPKPRNLQVLKNLPPGQLIPVMRLYCASLGVRCDFCHAGRDFASDAKPEKKIARKMILMTNSLNAHEKILDKKATCFMCHHGHAMPETQAPAEQERRP